MNTDFVFFDSAFWVGHRGDIIQVELAAEALLPSEEGPVGKSEVVARLRCDRVAALNLISALYEAVRQADEGKAPEDNIAKLM